MSTLSNNHNKLNTLLQHTVMRFAKYDSRGCWSCVSTEIPLEKFVDACEGMSDFNAEIQDNYWCVIRRKITPNVERKGYVVWRGSYDKAALESLKDKFFSYVKKQEEAK